MQGRDVTRDSQRALMGLVNMSTVAGTILYRKLAGGRTGMKR